LLSGLDEGGLLGILVFVFLAFPVSWQPVPHAVAPMAFGSGLVHRGRFSIVSSFGKPRQADSGMFKNRSPIRIELKEQI
jgi:hypothetical protein